jgi:porin
MFKSLSALMRTIRAVLAMVVATAVATTIRAQPPDLSAADSLRLTTDQSGQKQSCAAARDCSTAPATTDQPEDAPLPFGGPIFERPKLTGDWCGYRTHLQDSGITVEVSAMQFFQGMASGGLERSFSDGGRNDYFLNLDGEKLGLWKEFFINLHGETRYGHSANFDTGALSPVNEALLVPAETGTVTALTGVKFIQFLSENMEVFAGKINLLYDVRQPLTGATFLDGFMNTSLMFNTILARTLPYSSFGAGFVYLRDKNPVFILTVYDTNSTPTTSGFQSFFDNGALVFGILNLPTSFFELPGHQGLQGVYSSGKYTNLSPSPYLDPVNGLVFPSVQKTGSWALAYNFDQALHVGPDDPKRVWGVFGNLGIADNNPNPIQWYASAGISGASPIPLRKLDTFGIGYFHLGISSPLKQSAQPFSPLGNEDGLELYYNARVTPWFQITPDLQVINPFEQQVKTALVLGLRGKIDF